MCDDIHSTMRELKASGIRIDGAPEDEGWGISVVMTLPGDVQVMLYQPRHPLAISST